MCTSLAQHDPVGQGLLGSKPVQLIEFLTPLAPFPGREAAPFSRGKTLRERPLPQAWPASEDKHPFVDAEDRQRPIVFAVEIGVEGSGRRRRGR